MAKVILSSNNNVEYLFYLPITSFVWNYFGFESITIIVGESDLDDIVLSFTDRYCKNIPIKIEESKKYRSDTLAQCSRLYAACLIDNDEEYVILGDIDMIPLNSYLYRDFDKMNTYGYDLTGYSQYPMCYVGMYAHKWLSLMNIEKGKFIENMYRDLDSEPKASSTIWEEYWDTDQHILTNRIKSFGESNFNHVMRGQETNGLAFKRVDRFNWKWEVGVEYIDSHLLRNPLNPENFQKTYDLISSTLKTDCSWMKEYYNQISEKYARIVN